MMKTKAMLLTLILLLSFTMVVFAGDVKPTETPGPPKDTPVPSNTPTDTPTNVPTNTPTDTPTSTPTNTPTDTPTSTPTNTPTDTPTSTPTNTPTDTPTSTPTPPPDEAGEWCSPGYWRNHLDSWTEHDVLFSLVIGEIKLSKLGVKMERTANPTLLQVLQGPQYYTGDAFNEVADYLSGIYLDNYNGIRVEGSCPLN